MVYFKKALALGALFASVARAVTPLVAQGANFVNSVDGKRFQIIGVAYQPGGSSGFNPGSGVDPLSDGNVCLRDAVLLQRLGVNAIRVYNLDPDLDHTACASIFNAAGIYMILDVNSPLPNQSLNRAAPWESYDSDYLQRVFQVIEAFKNFNNTLGFFSANEVINQDSVSEVPAYIRAVTRDMKDYIAKQCPRPIPVGYSAADVRPLLLDTYEYLSCNLANETSSKMDFFGLNSYSWCGDATFESSGYDVLVEDFGNTTVPIFFSEYGCNAVKPRTFTEVEALYGPNMTHIFSGGLVYEWSEEPNDYGLVVINDNGSITLKSDYGSLMGQFDKIDLQALTSANSSATNLKAPTCSPSLITSNLTDSFDIPARPDGVQDFIDNGVQSNNGSFPTGTTSVSDTAEPVTVTDTNGNQITGLKLNILANNAYNLPGNNTSGTGSANATTTSSGSHPSSTKNAASSYHPHGGATLLGALTLGLLAQL